MARTRTLTLLRADVRLLADVQDNTDRHADSDLTRLVNQAIAEYRRVFSDLYTTTASATTTAGVATVALPAAFDEMVRVEIDSGNGTKFVVGPHESWEAQDYASTAFGNDAMPSSYRIEGSTLTFTPTPDAAYDVTLVYRAQQTDLSADSDTFDPIVAGGEQWVVYWAAEQVCIRDATDLAMQRLAMVERRRAALTTEMASRRRTPGPGRRVDTRGRRRELEYQSRYRAWRR